MAKLAGQAYDDRALAYTEICVDGAPFGNGGCYVAQPQTGAQTYVYEDTPAAPIALDSSTTCGGNEIVCTFTVGDSFTVGELDVGLNITHTFRDDVRALLADAHAQAYLTQGDHDAAAPYYDGERRPSAPLNTFRGQSAYGVYLPMVLRNY